MIEENKIIDKESALNGRAKLWFDMYKGQFQTNRERSSYENFKELFLDEFYSVPLKVKMKTKWLTKKYNAREESMLSYFYKQIKEARFFSITTVAI